MTLLIALATRIILRLLWFLPTTQELASQSTYNATATRMCALIVVARTTTEELARQGPQSSSTLIIRFLSSAQELVHRKLANIA